MYVHEDARLIYLAHPRTASTCTGSALQAVGFRRLGPPSDHHSPLSCDGSPVTADNRSDWTVFTTVRNHFDAAVSWLARKANRTEPARGIEAFEEVLGPGNRWIKPDRMWWLHSDDADVILRYERLHFDLAEVLAVAGLDFPTLIPRNVSENRRGRLYREFYDDESRAYIEGRFGEEMERFEYTFEEG